MPNTSDDPDLFRMFTEIGIINQLATTLFERTMPHDLTVAQFSLLNHLSKREPQPPLKLAKAFQVSKGTMTSTIGRLEAKGFVTVTPNPKDGRGKFVGITQAGRAARMDALAAAAPHFQWLSEHVDADAVSALTDRLASLRKVLDAERDGAT
jgi:DNA-binding MarR family transcriptional regulator